MVPGSTVASPHDTDKGPGLSVGTHFLPGAARLDVFGGRQETGYPITGTDGGLRNGFGERRGVSPPVLPLPTSRHLASGAA